MIFLVNSPDIKYQFWLWVPESPKHVVFWFHGSTSEPSERLASMRPIDFEFAISVLPDDCIVVTPLIPKASEEVDGRSLDPQTLCRNVLFHDLLDPRLEVYNRPDKEVFKILAYLTKFVFPVLRIAVDRFMVGGFSAGGTFASLFAMLHPMCVTHVISLMSCFYCLPVESIRNVRFDFPFGIGRLNLVSDVSPDVRAQKQIRYFIYHGELDDNDLIEGFANDDADEARAIKSIIGQTTAERLRYALQFLTQAGFTVEGHVIPGIGHEIHDRAALRDMLAGFLSS